MILMVLTEDWKRNRPSGSFLQMLSFWLVQLRKLLTPSGLYILKSTYLTGSSDQDSDLHNHDLQDLLPIYRASFFSEEPNNVL